MDAVMLMRVGMMASTFKTRLMVLPPYDAAMVTARPDVMAKVVMSNCTGPEEPAGMVTLAGTEAVLGSELVSVTTAPPEGAGPFRLTELPVTGRPPPVRRVVRTRDESAG